MNKKLKEKTMEALTSVLPVTGIVLLLSFTMAPMPTGTLMLFLVGAFLLIVGMGFFSLGTDMAMMPIGEGVGGQIVKTKKTWVAALICLVIGIFVTIAEPDLTVLAEQTPGVPDMVLILTVAVGVGIFLVVAMLRSKFGIPLNRLLIGLYIIVFVLSAFVPKDFLAVAFDSGGVTTGPITVPFIMALGVGLASLRTDRHSEVDSFGLVALCSVGPILAVMILGLCYNTSSAGYEPTPIPEVVTTQDVGRYFAVGFPTYLKEVAIGLLPILAFFLIFQVVSLRMKKRSFIKVIVGTLYTYIGLVLFLTGVNVGFMPAGHYIGATIAEQSYRWILIPLGMLIGYFIVSAEPAVHVLNHQVADITGGAISQKAMKTSLSIGVSVSLGLAMLRVLTGISIFWFILPGYAIALGLAFVVPRIFTAIAFDSGGVASGPMTATFLLPFAMGACEAMGGNILTDAFGIVAMVAMTPLITIQILGLIYKIKLQKTPEIELNGPIELSDEIIDYTQWEDDTEVSVHG